MLAARIPPLAVLLVALVAMGCSGPRAGRPDTTGTDRPDRPTETADDPREDERRQQGGDRPERLPVPDDLAAVVDRFETFDPAAFPERPPRASGSPVQHQVPLRLLQGRAAEGVRVTLEGYRIQLLSTQDKEEANRTAEAARQWWRNTRDTVPDPLFADPPPIVIEYGQPYYRVRLGAFAERRRAEEALTIVQREFDGAFIVQGRVTVTR
jgi:hypothetical protein